MTTTASVVGDDWLTAQLGVPAFHLHGDDVGALPPGRSFVDAKVPTTDIGTVRALEAAGFAVVDTAVTLRRHGRDGGPVVGDVGFARSEDADAVGRIAATSLTVSRFHLDPLIPDSVASSLKASWARNWFTGARGDWLVVGRAGSSVTGFLLLLDRPDALVIDLIAVDPDHQGRGIGAAMVAFAAGECGTSPAMVVGTQAANVGAIRFYEALGFRVEGTAHVLHRHGS